MKKLLSVLLVLVVVAGLVFASGSKESDSSAKSGETWGLTPLKERETLRIAFFTGSPLSYPFLFADNLGVFDALNIDIEYTCFTGGPAMMEANASWDIGSCGLGGIALALAKYDNLVMYDVCDYEENMAIFVRKDSAIAKDPKNPALWKGVTCVYPTGTTGQTVLAQYLQNMGLTLKDVVSVNADNSNALTVFNGGTGDVLCCWNAIALAADAAGHYRVSDSGQMKMPFPCASFVQKSYLASKPEVITLVTAVFHKAVEWCYESDANLTQAAQWYYDHCESEGFLCTREVAQKTMEWYRGYTVDEYIDVFTKTSKDDAGIYTARDLLQIEKDVLSGFDFFVSEGKYTKEQRQMILDQRKITNEVALMVKELVK